MQRNKRIIVVIAAIVVVALLVIDGRTGADDCGDDKYDQSTGQCIGR